MNIFFNIGNEELREDLEDLSDGHDLVNEQNNEGNDLAEEMHDYGMSKQIEGTLQNKVDRGEDLTDEEIYIATETIGNLFSNTANEKFHGFGFEQYEGKTLTQKEKSTYALEAITKQNDKKAKSFKAKIENLSNNLSDYFTKASGDMSLLSKDAKDVLNKIRKADAKDFVSTEIEDGRVSIALQRGASQPPFKDYKNVLSALKGNLDSLKVISSASKYESLGSGKYSPYDLKKLAKDLSGKIISTTKDSATYDLNADLLTGQTLTLKIPNNSDSYYVVKKLKANFVVTYKKVVSTKKVSTKTLSKNECIDLLESVIKYIDDEEYLFKLFYKDARIGFTGALKLLGQNIITAVVPFLQGVMYYNTLIFRVRMQSINSGIHYINRDVLRGLIAWAANSVP